MLKKGLMINSKYNVREAGKKSVDMRAINDWRRVHPEKIGQGK